MKLSSELLLTFLLNAVWQVALIAALASFGAWLLRDAAMRFQHGLWVVALCLSLITPLATAYRTLPSYTPSIQSELNITNPISVSSIPVPFDEAPATTSAFQLENTFAFGLLIAFIGVVLFRSVRLIGAWRTTRRIRHSTIDLEGDEAVGAIVRECAMRMDFQAISVSVCSSETVAVPITIGLFRPVIILPEALVRGGDEELLTSAIGHEFIHVARHDYVLNFLYELLYLPVSFHPAAALLRRRIKQTRELCCDELVAERILNAQAYARSLVALASSAPPLRRLSVTTTVGIADADILEARIMSLLSRPKMNRRWKKSLLFAVAVLLLVPSFAAAAFAMRFELATNPQEPTQQEKQAREKRKAEEETVYTVTERSKQGSPEMVRRKEMELEMREVRQAALVKLARINMDQAIQIATSQTPGKVLECSLNGERWEEPGKLAKDGYVFYHVVIADENNPGATHVLVNAVDGSIIKSEKELPRKRASETP